MTNQTHNSTHIISGRQDQPDSRANNQKQPSRMGKIMDMIYANSQCASIYFQVFDMSDAMLNEMYAIQTLENEQAQYQEDQCKAII